MCFSTVASSAENTLKISLSKPSESVSDFVIKNVAVLQFKCQVMNLYDTTMYMCMYAYVYIYI